MTAQQIVDLLNELHRLDPDCLRPLIEHRVPCNQAIADHATVTVDGDEPSGPWRVGLVGILEGICGIDGEVIAWEQDGTGKLKGFQVLGRRVEPHVPEPL